MWMTWRRPAFCHESGRRVFERELLAYPKPCFVNVGCEVDVSIRELAETVARCVGYEGRLA